MPHRPSVRPSVIVFDVNETLSDLAPMADRFADVGAPPTLAPLWFASVLRDGFALTVAGGNERFAVIVEETLRLVLSGVSIDRPLDAAVEHVMAGFTALSVHPDVIAGVRALNRAGMRLITLSNGPAALAQALLESAGVRTSFEALLSVEDAGVWKPARAAYEYAAHRCGVPAEELTLVAVHPWDIDGANFAGLSTVWLNRDDTPYPSFFTPPTVTVRSLTDLPSVLGR